MTCGSSIMAASRTCIPGRMMAMALTLMCLAPQTVLAARPKRGNVPSVLVVHRTWPPVVTIRVQIGAGALHDPVGQEGMASLCWDAALRGAGQRDRAQFAEALESLGAHLDVGVDKIGATVIGEVVADQLDAFLPLLVDAVLHPRFDAAEVERTREQMFSDLVQIRDDDESLAQDAIGRYLYRGQPLGRPSGGTEASLGRITVEAVKAWHARVVVAGNVRIGFAGPIDEAQAKALAEKWFGDLPRRAVEPRPALPRPTLDGRRLLLLDKSRRSQAQVVMAWPTVGVRHKDAIALTVANSILGGAFTSRLNHEIRELRGWSYNTWSSIAAGPDVSTLALGFASGTADTVPAIELAARIVEEMQQFGVTPAELRFAKDFLKGSHRFAIETADRELAMRMRAAELGIPAADIDNWPARIEAVDLRTLNRVLKQQFHPEHLVSVVVGAGKALKDKLEASAVQFAVEALPPHTLPETTKAPGRAMSARPPPIIEQPPPPDDEDAAQEPPEEGTLDEPPDGPVPPDSATDAP